MTDLITGIISNYGWTSSLKNPIKKTPRTSHDYVDSGSFMCSCLKENCTTHWCPNTKMLHTDCPCHNKGCGRVEPFVVSLRRTGYDGRCILITGNGNTGLDMLPYYGIEMYDAGNFTDHACLVRPRAVIEMLRKEQFRYILVVDTRDILFQSNPMTWVENHIGDYSLILTSEGSSFDGNTPTAVENSKRFIATYGEKEYEKVRSAPICNGGVMAGTSQATIEFRAAMQVEIDKFPNGTSGYGPRSGGWPSDQIIMNYLVNQERFLNRTLIVGPEHGFAFHRPYTSLGATVRDNVFYPPNSDAPYPIVHQYLEWSASLWPKYCDEYQIKF